MANVIADRLGVASNYKIDAEFPKKLEFLLGKKARYKVCYGGRGGTKSWAIARALLIRGIRQRGLRVLCTRQHQSSMKESVHQLLKDQIALLGLGGFYRVLDNEIRGPGGTLFTFKGLTDPEALKSTEGVDVVWIEEARIVTKSSWDALDPTIRKEDSEIWISFNPKLETDYLYKLFVANDPPPGSIVVKINWSDNPWFPEVLRRQMEHMRATDYDNYLHVWEGHCATALEGAVYARELRDATKEGRICRFSLMPSRPVHTFWDLGRSDLTAIWFIQLFGLENRVVRYYQNNGYHISHYIEELQRLEREEGYVFGTHWLPHDADEQRISSKRTTRQQVEDAGFRVKIVPKIGVSEGIQAARTIFPQTYFHEVEAADGINALRQYHYEIKDDGTRSKNPVHDWSSNGADAWRYAGVALRDDKPKLKTVPKPPRNVRPSARAWMSR